MPVVLLLIFALALSAQEPGGGSQNLLSLTDRLRFAMDAGDWKKAAELSSALKDAVREERDRTLAKTSEVQINRVIESLPENTETIVVAQQPFTLSEPVRNSEQSALTVARWYVLGLLGAADDEKPLKSLYGSTIRFAVLAARKFANQPPDGGTGAPLGMIAYQGCAEYAFASPIAQLAFPGLPDTTIAGHQVWKATGRQFAQGRDATPRSETYLMALLRPDLILACNNADFFSSILTNVDASLKGTLLQRLPEWKHVDRSAPVWGIRHFVPESAATDPTYPSNGGVTGTAVQGAIGMFFQVGLPAGKVRALWLSTSKENPWEELSKAPDFGGAASTRSVSEGVWELSVNDELGPGSFAVFAVMAMLGFAVFL